MVNLRIKISTYIIPEYLQENRSVKVKLMLVEFETRHWRIEIIFKLVLSNTREISQDRILGPTHKHKTTS